MTRVVFQRGSVQATRCVLEQKQSILAVVSGGERSVCPSPMDEALGREGAGGFSLKDGVLPDTAAGPTTTQFTLVHQANNAKETQLFPWFLSSGEGVGNYGYAPEDFGRGSVPNLLANAPTG